MLTAIKNNSNAVITIAFRDLIKFFRDGRRVVATFIFPFIFVGIVGSSFDSNLGGAVAISFIAYTFSGVLAQTLFQSAAAGIISLVQDRAEDFAQELFIAPVPRYVILLGKMAGEAMVAITQGIGILLFGLVFGVSLSWEQLVALLPVFIIVPMFGAAFGVVVMANLDDAKAVNQIFPFLLLPQYFLAGVFTPIANLHPALLVLSRIAPLTYAVDFTRQLLYGTDNAQVPTINEPWLNVVVIGVMFVIFLTIGTFIFVRNEKNR